MSALKQLLLLAGEIKTLIRYRACRLDEIITAVAANEAYSELSFLRELSAYSCSAAEISQHWSDCVNAQQTLTAEAKTQLCALGGQLGRSDIEGQLSCLSLFTARIEQALEDMRTEYDKKSRVLRSLGIYGGLAAAIIIL